ncbi:class 1 fructose-bisphosphatase [Antrihabitans sp. YC2-6]|uniref:class 1 fructose-bisphosphatase n=1 Tax=Antrihabitans sp. YC2-6 TaxID=2799498 RepID=UPI0018F68DDE|nr:class 1 fructose-bisphosphatase [Antrihabitans sp. YC2-6]MBJ8348401.1 class 1 fructose-bisphosphatase [Antrihabitans sp. YC2-6]
MPTRLKTLTRYTIEEEHRHPGSTGDFSALVNVLATAAKIISNHVTRGTIIGISENGEGRNTRRTVQHKLDAISNDVVLQETQWAGHLAAMLSQQMETFYPIPREYRRGKYLLAFDALDGSSNIDVNLPMGTVFSVLHAPDAGPEPCADDFLQAGVEQVCSGFTMYGPSTMLVLTTGNGVDGFTLDREIGAFVLTHPQMRIPESTSGFAINAANERFWEQPVRRYVQDCLDGAAGPRGKDYNMRWVASLVAEAFHILTRGGVYLYPRDTKDPATAGRVALLYGANPIAYIIEQAGGAASTGRERIMEIAPESLHQRVPLIFGSKNEVMRIENYHLDPAAETIGFNTSLFSTRSLFR